MPQAIRTHRPTVAPKLELVKDHDAGELAAVEAHVAQHASKDAHHGWHGMVTKLMVGASLFAAVVMPGAQTQKPFDASLLNARTAQMQIMTQKHALQEMKLPPGTTFRLVAPGPQHVVTADDALSFIVAAFRMEDGSKVSFADVRALNPKIFARDATGSVLVPGDVVTLPLGAVQKKAPHKLVTRAEIADTIASPGHVVTLPSDVDTKPVVKPVVTPVVDTRPVVAPVVSPVVDTRPADVTPVVDTRPVDRPVVTTPVVDTRPAVADHAAFKFSPLKVGTSLPAEGVFKTKQFFKTWTIEFAGSAKVVASDAGKLVLHVKAVGQNGIFEGKSRTVALEWHQQGNSNEVRFSGKEIGSDDGDVGGKLQLVSASATESVFKDAKDGKLVRLKIEGSQMTLTYQDNVIHFRLSP
jgi:hypothetical protein